MREPFSKPLGDGIFEVRAKQGSDISRVLYFFVVGKRVILTNGFIKKTAKTPPREIERAKRYRAEATGINQADISRLESGTANPSLRTLKRLAAGMGMALKVEFVPIQP